MLRGVTLPLIILIAFMPQAQAEEALETFVDKLVDRVLKSPPSQYTDLNEVTLEKPGPLTVTRCNPSSVSALHLSPSRTSQFPLLGGCSRFVTDGPRFIDVSANAKPRPVQAEVAIGDREPFERALMRFRNQVRQAGHVQELRWRRYFEDAQTLKKRKAKDRGQRMKRARLDRQRQEERLAQRNNPAMGNRTFGARPGARMGQDDGEFIAPKPPPALKAIAGAPGAAGAPA